MHSFRRVCFYIAVIGIFFGQAVSPAFAQEATFVKKLQRGMSGGDVKNLQVLLKSFVDIYPQGIVSGYFGPLTERAVQMLQKKYGLEQVGLVGPKTRVVLNNLATRLVVKEEASEAPPPPLTSSPIISASATLPVLTSTQSPYFTYSWRATSTLTGEVFLPKPAPRPIIILDGKSTVILESSAAVRLAEIYKIVLVDNEEPWDDFSATMLLEMMRRLPDTRHKSWDNKPWQVSLTKQSLTNDIDTIPYAKETAVRKTRFSKAAFVFSNPTLQPGAIGSPDRVFYSNRLFRAVLRSFFNERSLLEDILQKRYGVKTGFGEPLDEFQEFSLEELQYALSVFEDLPAGFRNIPGFEKIVRRKQGLTNPWFPGAPAIAWVDLGYIEFMDGAFRSGSEEYIRRLVAHEITHFLWHKVLTEDTRQKFAALSGWSKVSAANIHSASEAKGDDHPKANYSGIEQERWYRLTTTNFVSGYAAAWNPDEDFAETISYYVYQSDWVRTIAPDKYEFVKNVIDGYEYVVLVEKQFTFQVFNLEPDVTFPGKIIGVDTEVFRLPNGNSRVVATLRLSKDSGDGAERAFSRIFSSVGTYVDVYFYPASGSKFMLRAEFTITQYAAKGYWMPDQITVQDRVDNRRYEGQNHFGWLLYIDNPNEDLEAPIADLNNIRGELVSEDGEQVVKVYVPVTDKNETAGLGGLATMPHYDSKQEAFNYAEHDRLNRRLVYKFVIRKYKASGVYTFREFWVWDIAGNQNRYDLKEKSLTFNVVTERPDYTKPELDISSIKIRAISTKPQAPDGETDVTIWYVARDDNSGLGNVNYILQKPTGDTLYDYNYHENFYTNYFVGDPTQYKTYQIDLRLPQGSPPGTWVLQQIGMSDKAGNQLTNNFVEIGILNPFDVK